MNNHRKAAVACFVGAALLFGTAACADTDDDRCDSSTVYVPMFFSTVDRHYHYGSPTGKVVPANKVPSSARKVAGYKPPTTTPKAPVNKTPDGKVDTTKPGGTQPKAPAPAPKAPAAKQPAPAPAPAPKAPAAPAPAPRIR